MTGVSRPEHPTDAPEPTAAPEDAGPPPGSPFERLADFAAIPRVGGLALSADGTRLAVSVQTLDPERTRWQSALWEVDPAGQRPPRRLTRSAPGESAPAFAPDGTLLFVSARPTRRPARTPASRSRRCGRCRPGAGRPARW